MCRELGLHEDTILGLADHQQLDDLSELEKLALDYAVALSDTPAEVPDELYEALASRLSEKQLIELRATVAFENYLALRDDLFAASLGAGIYVCLIASVLVLVSAVLSRFKSRSAG